METETKDNKIGTLLKSRRFWVAAIGLAAVVSSEAFGFQLDTEQLTALSAIIITWIVGDTLRETK